MADQDLPGIPEEPKKQVRSQRKMTKEYQAIRDAVAITKHGNLKDAYLATHTKATTKHANTNCYRMLTPEVVENLKRIMLLNPQVQTTRLAIEKMLYAIIAQYFNGDINVSGCLKAIELLSKLVPDFKDRMQVEDLSTLPESELDKKLRELGFDPTSRA